MTSHHHPVVVGVDGSPGSDAAARWAAEEARRRRAPLRVVHVFRSTLGYGPSLSPWPERDTATARNVGEQVAAAAAELAAAAAPGLEIAASTITGGPVPELLAEAAGASVLVVGSRRRHTLGSFVLGSISAAVAATASCPVVVIRGPDHPTEGTRRRTPQPRVVAGVDGDETSQDVLGYAFEHADRYGLGVQAVMCRVAHTTLPIAGSLAPVREAFGHSRTRTEEIWLSEALAGWQDKYPDVPVTRTVIDTDPVGGLTHAGAGAHLLVVGSHGRHALTGTLLGSVSQGVLHHATCPVAVVPTHRR